MKVAPLLRENVDPPRGISSVASSVAAEEEVGEAGSTTIAGEVMVAITTGGIITAAGETTVEEGDEDAMITTTIVAIAVADVIDLIDAAEATPAVGYTLTRTRRNANSSTTDHVSVVPDDPYSMSPPPPNSSPRIRRGWHWNRAICSSGLVRARLVTM